MELSKGFVTRSKPLSAIRVNGRRSLLESAHALKLAPVVGRAKVVAMCHLDQMLVGVEKKRELCQRFDELVTIKP